MHIPDGFLDWRTTAVTAALASAGVAWASKHVRETLPPSKIPLLGLGAAFVFAAQMLNFPVAGGTSGHLIGGVLVAVLLGPSAGLLVITAVLIVQCLVFADGGLLALGANVFNMGVLGAVAGYGVYRAIRRWLSGLQGQLAAAGFAAWCSVVLAAVSCAAQLAASGTVAWRVAFPAMAGVHMLIGAGEAVITVLVLAAIAAARPELLREDSEAGRSSYADFAFYGLLAALGLALFVSPLASAWPDGLEKVAADLGFLGKAAPAPLAPAPIPDYTIPGIGSPAIATALAGAAGTLLMFVFALVLARLVARRRSPPS